MKDRRAERWEGRKEEKEDEEEGRARDRQGKKVEK